MFNYQPCHLKNNFMDNEKGEKGKWNQHCANSQLANFYLKMIVNYNS